MYNKPAGCSTPAFGAPHNNNNNNNTSIVSYTILVQETFRTPSCFLHSTSQVLRVSLCMPVLDVAMLKEVFYTINENI
jgi:hypothetical protein